MELSFINYLDINTLEINIDIKIKLNNSGKEDIIEQLCFTLFLILGLKMSYYMHKHIQ